jgi:hypothetical protein
MDESLDSSDSELMSDAEFMRWAGTHPQRWALLPGERRESWLDHLVARMQTTSDPEKQRAYWRLATVIAHADRAAPPSVDD